jgi:Flp pilus assembly protein TadG
MTHARSEHGQAFVLTVIFLTVLLGMSALVLDVGSWFRSQRAAQAAADAAALAGAESLPGNTAGASAAALSNAAQNGGGLAAADITFQSASRPGDTIVVTVRRPSSGFFSGIASLTVSAHAAAKAFTPGQAQWVAPIVVRITHPDLSGPGCPCFGPSHATTLPLNRAGAPGAFDMLDLNLSQTTGTAGTSTLGSWLRTGFNGYLPVNQNYRSDPGASFNSSNIQSGLSARLNTDLLFPVYDTITGTGSNAVYHVIGWAAFHLTGYSISGRGSLSGYFTATIWDGIESSASAGEPDLGTHSIELVQ